MKLRKVLSSVVAGAIAVSAMAISASAVLKTVPQNGHFFSGTGSWMPLLYSDGTIDVADGKEATDYGLDLSQIGTIEVTLVPSEPDYFEGAFGGGIILSTAKTDHNWPSKTFWGVVDDDLEINSINESEPVQFKKVGDYTYMGVMTVDDSNCVLEGAHLVQLAIQEWGQELDPMIVKSVVVKDKSGNEMISFDENGTASLPLLDASAPAAEEETAAADEEEAAADEEEAAADEEEAADEADADEDEDADEEAPVEEEVPAPVEEEVPAPVEEEVPAPVEEVPAPVEEDADADEAPATPAQTEAAPAQTEAAPAQTEAAPAVTEAAADSGNVAGAAATQAPAAGNVAAATNSSKGSPDTGVADVAAVAGLAIVAGGAVLVAKKRK